ncbi:hypothetical protein [Roseivivax sp. CAU 1761]
MTASPSHPRSRLQRLIEAQVPRKMLRDVTNRLRYGPGAPLSDECIWIDPRAVRGMFRRRKGADFRRRHSGVIAGGDWDLDLQPLSEAVKIAACERRFGRGESWEETGIIDEMMRRIEKHGVFDECRSREDVLRRYAGIDRMYEEIARAGRLEPQGTRPDALHREHGGIFVHIGRNGAPILAGNGNHRLAIARILGLARVPAQLGALHRGAWEAGLLPELRRPAPGEGPGSAGRGIGD